MCYEVANDIIRQKVKTKIRRTITKMKKILFMLALFITSCSMVVWSDINDYKGCVILKVEHDSVGTIDTYHYTLRDALTGEFYKIPINPDFHFFEEGDTIK
jgi:hypothetical protein